MMKYLKSITIAFAVFSVLCFFSCKKDGVYNPKGKISKIFYESTYSNKTLDETWTWDKNLLTKITDGDGSSFLDFVYEGKKLTEVKDGDGFSAQFTYNGRKISKIEIFSNGKSNAVITVEHDGGKIVQISTVIAEESIGSPSQKAKSSTMLALLFGRELSERMVNTVEECAKANTRKANRQITIKYEWDGANIVKADYEANDGGTLSTWSYVYEYDENINPYYNSLYHEFEEGVSGLSKNNITKETRNENGNVFTNVYTYTYSDKLPITRRYEEGGAYYSQHSYEYVQ